MGLDLGLKNDRTMLTVCSSSDVQRVALDRSAVRQGSRQRPVSLDVIEATVLEAWRAFQYPFVS
jgi:hypothetical protein